MFKNLRSDVYLSRSAFGILNMSLVAHKNGTTSMGGSRSRIPFVTRYVLMRSYALLFLSMFHRVYALMFVVVMVNLCRCRRTCWGCSSTSSSRR